MYRGVFTLGNCIPSPSIACALLTPKPGLFTKCSYCPLHFQKRIPSSCLHTIRVDTAAALHWWKACTLILAAVNQSQLCLCLRVQSAITFDQVDLVQEYPESSACLCRHVNMQEQKQFWWFEEVALFKGAQFWATQTGRLKQITHRQL